MPSYVDILRQYQDRNRVTRQYQPTNPFSSSAYTNEGAVDALSQARTEQSQTNPMITSDMYTEPTNVDRAISAYENIGRYDKIKQNLTADFNPNVEGVQNLASQVKDLTEKYNIRVKPNPNNPLYNVTKQYTEIPTEGIGGPVPTAETAATVNPATAQNVVSGYNMPGMNPGGFLNQNSGAIAAIAYGLANDNNPYTYDTKEALGMGVGDYMTGVTATNLLGLASNPALAAAAPYVPLVAAGLGYLFRSGRKKKKERQQSAMQSDVQDRYENLVEQQRRRVSNEQMASRGDVGNTMYGGYMYNTGGKKLNNITAEFTGNELIVNDQDIVEQGLKEGNFKKAAGPIRKAMKGGMITPGEESHKNNPMPVTSDGTIYAGGGPLNFKVGDGAGVYDHASDQFKEDMSDKQIAKVAMKNIKKWKKNNMYS